MPEDVRHHPPNDSVRIYAILEGIPIWKLAESFGMDESGLNSLLAEELPQRVKEILYTSIETLAREEEQMWLRRHLEALAEFHQADPGKPSRE